MPYYRFDVSKLRQGDIILERSDDDLSRRVRQQINSEYSHAILFMGNHSFLESISSFGKYFSAQRYVFSNKDDLLVKRLISEKSSEELLEKITESATRYSFREYDLRAAINSSKVNLEGSVTDSFSEWNKGIFCSLLIGLSYLEAGVNIIPEKHISLITPKDIEISNLFVNINDFLIEVPEDELQGYTIRDKQRPPNSLEIEDDIAVSMFKQIKTEYSSVGLAVPADFLAAVFELPLIEPFEKRKVADEILVKILNDSGYLDLWKDVGRLYPYLNNPIQFIHSYRFSDSVQIPEILKDVVSLVNSLSATITKQSKYLNDHIQAYETTGLGTYKLLSEMRKNWIDTLSHSKELYENIKSTILPMSNMIESKRNQTQ